MATPASCRWSFPAFRMLRACTPDPFPVTTFQPISSHGKLNRCLGAPLLHILLITLTLSSFLVYGPRGDLLLILSWALYTSLNWTEGGVSYLPAPRRSSWIPADSIRELRNSEGGVQSWRFRATLYLAFIICHPHRSFR